MMATNIVTKIVVIFGGFCLLAACGAGLWKGREFSGEGKINGAKPSGNRSEKFKLETIEKGINKRKFITMDAANSVLGYCGLEVWNRNDLTEGKFELVYPDTECDTMLDGKKVTVFVTSGDITIAGDEVKLVLVGREKLSGKVYNFEINGKSKDLF